MQDVKHGVQTKANPPVLPTTRLPWTHPRLQRFPRFVATSADLRLGRRRRGRWRKNPGEAHLFALDRFCNCCGIEAGSMSTRIFSWLKATSTGCAGASRTRCRGIAAANFSANSNSESCESPAKDKDAHTIEHDIALLSSPILAGREMTGQFSAALAVVLGNS